ncbi:MAG: ADP-ribosylation factor-like protein [Promethearchaeota archaeon]
MKITLSLWDIAGQERFDFFKTDFYKGVAAIGLVFDLSRPDTFDDTDIYFNDIRNRSGNIPIILVGNKNDLKKDLGEIIPRERIIQKVNQYHLFEYIETSALENENVDNLFNRLAIIALLDLKPRLGEVVDINHFRFKILLVGDAAVGKSSLIKTFIGKKFETSYKLTVGLDFMTRDFEIPNEDLPKEVQDAIKKSVKTFRKKFKRLYKKEVVPIKKKTTTNKFLIETAPDQKISKIKNGQHIFKKLILLSLPTLIIVLIIIYFVFFLH